MKRCVLCAQVQHETNSFSRQMTGLNAFRQRDYTLGPAILDAYRGTNTEMAAFIAAAERYGWDLVPLVAAEATPSGPVTVDAYAHFTDLLLDAVAEHAPDAILLALHGAMAAENEPDADGVLASRLRAALPPSAALVVSLDMHANVSDRLAGAADAIVTYRTYPHQDLAETGDRAAVLLERAFSTGSRPTSRVWRLPLLDGCDNGRSGGTVMPRLLDHARSAERGDIWSLSVFPGFAWADAAHAGPSVVVSGQGIGREPPDVVRRLLSEIWRTRDMRSIAVRTPEEAVDRAIAIARQGGHAVLADFADNPGGGGYGDGTALLALLIRAGQRAACAPIWDPEAAARAAAGGVGSRLRLEFGGKTDARFGGGPLSADVEVIGLGDGRFVCEGPMWRGRAIEIGPVATLRIGTVDVLVASRRMQVTEPAYFRCGGIEPTDHGILLLKSHQHFRAAFEPIADEILYPDAGGLVSFDYRALPYRRVRRPIWPLDDVDSFNVDLLT